MSIDGDVRCVRTNVTIDEIRIRVGLGLPTAGWVRDRLSVRNITRVLPVIDKITGGGCAAVNVRRLAFWGEWMGMFNDVSL